MNAGRVHRYTEIITYIQQAAALECNLIKWHGLRQWESGSRRTPTTSTSIPSLWRHAPPLEARCTYTGWCQDSGKRDALLGLQCELCGAESNSTSSERRSGCRIRLLTSVWYQSTYRCETLLRATMIRDGRFTRARARTRGTSRLE